MTREDGIGFCPECGRRASWVTLDGWGGCGVHGRIALDWNRKLPAVDVRDFEGTRIAVGQRTVDAAGREDGTVVGISEPDADYSDRAERAVERGPVVTVEYDSGESIPFEAFARYTRGGDHDGYEADEVVVKEDS